MALRVGLKISNGGVARKHAYRVQLLLGVQQEVGGSGEELTLESMPVQAGEAGEISKTPTLRPDKPHGYPTSVP